LKLFFAKHGRALAGLLLCVLAFTIVILFGGFDKRVRSADILSGKWSGNVVWNDASGVAFTRTLRTSLYFQPNGLIGTVMNFKSGAIAGSGTYTLKDSRLTVRCVSLSVNGTPLPMSLVSGKPWFHPVAVYNLSFDGKNLTLAPVSSHPPGLSAPAYPLLVTLKPIVLSRAEEPLAAKSETAPKE
jgi:hypothetical protein